MGKGSKRRPTLVDEETFAERWERTFGRTDTGGLATEEDERARVNGPATLMTIFPPIHHYGGRGRR